MHLPGWGVRPPYRSRLFRQAGTAWPFLARPLHLHRAAITQASSAGDTVFRREKTSFTDFLVKNTAAGLDQLRAGSGGLADGRVGASPSFSNSSSGARRAQVQAHL